MPSEHYVGLANKHMMSAQEVLDIASTFVELGVRKIRLTGGEPLVRKDISEILVGLKDLGCQLDITSNGILLDKYWDELRQSGISTLNLSIDTLNADRFKEIARRDELDRVLTNIHKALDYGFKVKLNCVVIANFNEDEIVDFVELTRHHDLDIRFIEFMPFNDNKWEWEKVVSLKKILEPIEAKYEFEKCTDHPNSTSKNFQVRGYKGRFGVISSVTAPFCSGCNRMRLTADGKMRNCLFSTTEFDLLTAYRNDENLVDVITQCLASKKKELGGLPEFKKEEEVLDSISERSMIKIGG